MGRVALVAVLAVLLGGCGGSDTTSSPSPPRIIAVPNLVGMQVSRAEDLLKTKGLRPSLAWLNRGPGGEKELGRCVGLPGHGPVSAQDPLSGSTSPAGSSVRLATGCANQTALPTCARHDFKLTVTDGGGTGYAWEYVKITHVSGPPCGLDGPATLSVEQDGHPLALVGNNPATIHLTRPMGVGEQLELTWPEGGCPEPLVKHVTYLVGLGSRSASRDGELNCGTGDQSSPHLAKTVGPGDARHIFLQAGTSKRGYEKALAKTSN
jgi:hypothetical protein